MKKNFLLTLLCVSFLTILCQTSFGKTEVISKISINKFISDEEIEKIVYKPFEKLYRYRWIITDPHPWGGFSMDCLGFGPYVCLTLKDIFSLFNFRGVAPESIQNTCNNLLEESEARTFSGEYKGTQTKKIAIPGTSTFIICQMTWDYDPLKPYNGKAEIVISQTDELEMR